ncbi:hypothetical protein ACKAWT_20800 [Xanthomonas vasicola]|nr:hypothetical protein [Xanthomonas vasicola]MDO6949234.1 hypothetical protein [Xanthomonas vasicola]MDO6957992.1 hypothetical protein [Xanthomonas vasicola]MDO6961368.1 hypothetical protein [Xanthomonas vasicola]MDO6970218.1 hypothetical protein [Xanthomonas vasicola]MDO6975001.1 hypothetical protein [Xanthomonas vasicola]
MAKKSDAKRRAKLKERRKNAEASQARIMAAPDVPYEWKGPTGDEPETIAALTSDDGDQIAYIEGYSDDGWEFVVDYQTVAASSDDLAMLKLFLDESTNYVSYGNVAMSFSPWLIEKLEARCEAESIQWNDLLRSLLPVEKQHMQLPQQRAM